MLHFSLTRPRRVLLARVPCRFLYPGHDEGSRVELSCLHCTLDNIPHFLRIGKREREKNFKVELKLKQYISLLIQALLLNLMALMASWWPWNSWASWFGSAAIFGDVVRGAERQIGMRMRDFATPIRSPAIFKMAEQGGEPDCACAKS